MRYIIAAPRYSRKSAGIVVLHELQKWLIRFGKDAMILNFKVPYEIEEDDIVVYPEIVPGNPLKARRVVRYILNEPGKLGGDREYDKNEILVAYDGTLAKYSNGIVLTTPILEEFFSNRGYERTIDCLWVGKGENTNHPITRNCIEITYQWPAKRRELAELLNRARTLYSYDDHTSLLTEAVVCGCEVKLIKNNEMVNYSGGPPNLEAFKTDLEQFINLTWYPEINPAEAAIEIDKQLSLRRSRGHNSVLPSHYCPLNPREYSISDGEALFAMGEVEDARRVFEQLLSSSPGNVEALNNLAVIAFQQGEMDQAVSYFTRALEIHPDHFESLENLGNCMVAQKAYGKAIECFERALHLKPDDAMLLNSLASCFIQIEDFTRARELYTKSYQLDSNQPQVGEILAGLEKLKSFETERISPVQNR